MLRCRCGRIEAPFKTMDPMAEKMYLLDTNVLIHDPEAIFKFSGSTVGIPSMVLEELDGFKREGSDRAHSAREAIRHLDALRNRGSLKDGVELDNGSIVKVMFLKEGNRQKLPFTMPIEDNHILLLACTLKDEYDIRFITKDFNARVKADALGLAAEDYLKGRITKDEFYHGWRRIQVPSVSLKKGIPPELEEYGKEQPLEMNEFVLAESNHNPHNFGVFRHMGRNKFVAVEEPQLRWPLKSRNPQQLMALNLLLDDTVQLVSLFGPAGTGKTFMALLAGIHKVLVEDQFEKVLVARPVVPLGKDIGYLPGDVHEKLYNWMLPVYDNVDFIVHSTAMEEQLDEANGEVEHASSNSKKNRKGKHQRRKKEKTERPGGLQSLDDLISRGKVSLEAITYMRGRSIPYQFIFIDEVQNLTLHEVKTLVSRVGEGSKIVLAGDPYQIDAPYLDFASNGLVVATEKMKGQAVFGSVYLETSERSLLSQLTSELL
jgi:PhoH-like ATPase